MPIGQTLIKLGYLDQARLSLALTHQIEHGARLGTNLIELGHNSQDQVSQALGKLHSVPATLERHLSTIAPEAVQSLSPQICQEHFVAPIAIADRSGTKTLVVCMRDPWDQDSVEAVRIAADMPLIASVGPELTISITLFRLYQIRPQERFLLAAHGAGKAASQSSPTRPVAASPSKGTPKANFPNSFSMELVDLDDSSVVKEATSRQHISSESISIGGLTGFQSSAQRVERNGNRPSSASQHMKAAVVAAKAEKQGASLSDFFVPDRPEDSKKLTFREASEAIEQAKDRDGITSAILDYMRGGLSGGLIAIVKKDMALGLSGFGESLTPDNVESVIIPLASESMFAVAVENKKVFFSEPPKEGEQIQKRFFKLFSKTEIPNKALIVPIIVKEKVICLIYGQGARQDDDIQQKTIDALEVLASKASEAFLRLIISSKKSEKRSP